MTIKPITLESHDLYVITERAGDALEEAYPEVPLALHRTFKEVMRGKLDEWLEERLAQRE